MQSAKIWFASKILLLVFFCAPAANAQTTRPDTEKQLAHDIYKEFIEIQSGFTTGSTTPVAEAAAGCPGPAHADAARHGGRSGSRRAALVSAILASVAHAVTSSDDRSFGGKFWRILLRNLGA